MKRLIYPASRAVEHAVSVAGVRPVRLFPVLWPLWQLHTTAEVDEEQNFDVIDHFIVRAIGEAGIGSRTELVRFLGLPPDLTGRCLRFLEMIRHVTINGDALALDDLGRRSLAAGVRLVSKESRQTLYIERHTGQPLARQYYVASVQVLSTLDVPEEMLGDRSRFLPIYLPAIYRHEVVEWLAQHPDRASLNLPSQLRQLRRVGDPDEGYLPVYLIETAEHGLLVYSALAEERDSFFESVCRQVALTHLVEAQAIRDPREVWTPWLARQSGQAILRQFGNGMWRAAFSPNAFGPAPKIPHTRIGSYQIEDNHLLQIWSDDPGTRQVAAKERALGIATLPEVQNQTQLRQRVECVARTLDVTQPSLDELRKHATQTGDSRRLAHLDLLIS